MRPYLPLALGLWACASAPTDPTTPHTDASTDTDVANHTDVPTPPTPLPPTELLVRLSLDLRGIRPTVAELEQVQADPDALDALIDAFLASPRFARRVREIYDEVFLIRDEKPFIRDDHLLLRWSREDLSRSIGEEPTRMLAYIAEHDLPYTDFVTADWTMANEVTADLFPVDYPAGATGWQQARYTDQRPAAGVLVSNGWWWQFGSMLNNLNRGRANQFSRVLMCFDYLDTQIDFTNAASLDSEASLSDAIRNDPSCTGCHKSLDPLAAHFYGFWYYAARRFDPHDIARYHPEREHAWADLGGLPPAFRRTPTTGIADLGRRTAAEPEYSACFTERSFAGLLRRAPTEAEEDQLEQHDAAFRQAAFNIRALYRHIVHGDAYRQGQGPNGLKLISAAVLSSQIEDLTGFVWSEDQWDLLRAPELGFGPLTGTLDDTYRSVALTESSATLALVHKRLAEAAAAYVVQADLDKARTAPASLLTSVDGTEDPTTPQGEAAIRTQLARLHTRILTQSVQADSPEVDALLNLWLLAHTGDEPTYEAWAAVISVLLRDMRLLVY